MRKTGWMILALAVGIVLAAGFPVKAVLADPGCGCGHHEGHGQGCRNHGERCPDYGHDCGDKGGMGHAGPPCMQDNAAASPGGMHRMMHGGGGPAMKEGMGRHMEEMRGTILKLRALEAKMDAVKAKDDAAFRAAALEHARLLTDLQESHLKHMEGMMGK